MLRYYNRAKTYMRLKWALAALMLTLRETAPAMQTLSSTVTLLLLDSTMPSLLPPSLGCCAGDGVASSLGFSAAVDAAACLSLGCSVADGDGRVTVTLVKSSMKSHDVSASATRPSGLHPSSTTSTICNVQTEEIIKAYNAVCHTQCVSSKKTCTVSTKLIYRMSKLCYPYQIIFLYQFNQFYVANT